MTDSLQEYIIPNKIDKTKLIRVGYRNGARYLKFSKQPYKSMFCLGRSHIMIEAWDYLKDDPTIEWLDFIDEVEWQTYTYNKADLNPIWIENVKCWAATTPKPI